MEKISNQSVESQEIDPLTAFWNSMTPEMYETLDIYGFNPKGIEPELMLQITDSKNRLLVLEMCGEFKRASSEDRKKIALKIAELVDQIYEEQ